MRTTIFIAGVGLSFTAMACAEAYAFNRPADISCERRPSASDFGPPAGCGGEPGEHGRGTTVTTLSTGTVGGALPATVVVWNSEDVRLDHFPFQYSRVVSDSANTGERWAHQLHIGRPQTKMPKQPDDDDV